MFFCQCCQISFSCRDHFLYIANAPILEKYSNCIVTNKNKKWNFHIFINCQAVITMSFQTSDILILSLRIYYYSPPPTLVDCVNIFLFYNNCLYNFENNIYIYFKQWIWFVFYMYTSKYNRTKFYIDMIPLHLLSSD